MERRFPREIGSLGAIFAFVREFLAAHGIDVTHAFELDFILEELFTNTVRHGRGGADEVLIGLARDGRAVTLTVRDFDVEAFDVTKPRAIDPYLPIEKRE